MLAAAHPHHDDGRISFDPCLHEYKLDGAIVPSSCTSLVGMYFPQFDGKAVVERYYGRWKTTRDVRYAALIQESKGG